MQTVLVVAVITVSYTLNSAVRLRAADPVTLERTLVRAAPSILQHCRDRGYKTVGVLKFQVAKDGALTDNAGSLNRTVARQLELALILANTAEKGRVDVVDDASAVAAKTPGANHLTKEGRLTLFGAKYPLPYGTEFVTPDAFLTGVIGVGDDLKTLEIKLYSFDKAANKLVAVGEVLTAANDPRKLSEIGESFTRGAFDGGSVESKSQARQEQVVLEQAARVKVKAAPNPAAAADAAVKLEILYDGKAVPVEVKDGKAFVAEPREGQAVSFRLARAAGAGQAKLACVLKVNGENTLGRERLPDFACRKWLLFPEDTGGILVKGFQKDATTAEQFRVLSKSESKARELDYGADVGTVTLTVFAEGRGPNPKPELTEEGVQTKVVTASKLPAKKPSNFDALTKQLEDDANRGLIAEGQKVGNTITVMKFTADPTPVMSLTVTYYKK